MGIVFGAIGVLVLILLVLRIIQTVSPTKVQFEYTVEHSNRSSGLTPLPPMPERTPEQIAATITGGGAEWVTYPGMTPPLRLNMRGQSLDGYRLVLRAYAKELGIADLASIPPSSFDDMTRAVMARAYVTDWEGPTYPNGVAMPYSPVNLASLFAGDNALVNFISENAQRISPRWPVS